MASQIEVLRRLVDSQLRAIGSPVSNLLGAVAGQSPAILVQQEQRWLIAQLAGTRLLTPDEFYSAYFDAPTSQRTATVRQAVDGIIVQDSFSKDAGLPSTFLWRSVTDNPGPILLPLTVSTDEVTAEFAIYVDGVLQRRANGTVTIPLSLTAGSHLIEITAVAKVMGLAFPPTIRFRYDLDLVSAPQWYTIRTGFIDPLLGTLAVNLEWFNDIRAGGWIIYRRIVTFLMNGTVETTITTVGLVDGNGIFGMEVDGDCAAQIPIGASILAGNEPIGSVLSAIYSVDSDTTIIKVKIQTGLEQTNPDAWVGRPVAVGQFAEINRVRRTTRGGTVKWDDLGVQLNTIYEYALQAFGLFDESQLSPLSDIKRIVAGDLQPPGKLIFDPGFPIATLDLATAKFTTPADKDYEGCYVIFYDLPTDGFGTSTGNNTATTLVDDFKAWTPDQFAGFTVLITDGTGKDQTVKLLGNTATVLNVDPLTPFITIPDTTSTYEVYRLVNVMTDFGVPATKDQITFSLEGEGTYYFPTFDHGQNVQPLNDAATWLFNSADQLTTPITNALVFDRTEDGLQSQTIMGITLYSVPPANEIVADIFEGPTTQRFNLIDTGVFAATGNTTRIFSDPTKSWGENSLQGMEVRVYSPGADFQYEGNIIANTSNTITIDSDFPLPPDSANYQIAGHLANKTPTGTELWTVSNETLLMIQEGTLKYVGSPGQVATLTIDSGRSTNFRLEAMLHRGGAGHGDFGSNLTCQGDPTNTMRLEFGCVHVDDNTVNLRYRYNSGGSGSWTDLATGYPWAVNSARKLAIEVHDDVHSFIAMEAHGHDERTLLRTPIAGIPSTATMVGWAVSGNPPDVAANLDGDTMDEFRVLNWASLVRIKYKLLPDDETLNVPLWTGTVYSGNTALIVDPTKYWDADELRGAFLRLTSGPGVGSDVLIQGNSSTAITPASPLSAIPTNSTTYLVYEKYFTGTERLEFWRTRSQKAPNFLLWHGERLGSPDEVEHRMLIDANDIPQITLKLSVKELGTVESFLQCDVEPDDDVASWRLLLRKGNWPTVGHMSGGQLFYDLTDRPDPQYTKFLGNTNFRSQVFQVANALWYGIAVPYDTNGHEGIIGSDLIDIGSQTNPGGGPFLTVEVQPPSFVSPLFNTTLVPAPVIQLRNAAGQPDLVAGVTVTCFDDPNNNAITAGTAAVATDANGRATFSNLHFEDIGGQTPLAYYLNFLAPGYSSARSTSINQIVLSDNYLVIVTPPPPSAVVNVILSIQPVIQLTLAAGGPSLVAGVPVSVMASNGYGVAFDTGGTTNAEGLVTWTGLRFTGSGPGTSELIFNAPGYGQIVSQTIDVSGAGTSQNSLSNLRVGHAIVGLSPAEFYIAWTFPTDWGWLGVNAPAGATVDIFAYDVSAPSKSYWVKKNLSATHRFSSLDSTLGPYDAGLIPANLIYEITNTWTFSSSAKTQLGIKLYYRLNGVLQNVLGLVYSFYGKILYGSVLP